MLNENTLKLLGAVVEKCKGNSYKVFSFSELALWLSGKDNIDDKNVKEKIMTLSEHGYVCVKYVDDAEVCLSVLEKGRQALEINAQAENLSAKNCNRSFIWAFWGAFIGGAITSLLSTLILAFSGCV